MDIADNGGNYDNNTGKSISITPKNVSTQTSFVELPGMLCDNTTANNQPQDLMCDQDPTTDNISNNNNIDNDAGSSTASAAVGGKANSITQSTSSASNLSLNTTTTSKTGSNNNNNRLPSRRSGGSSTLSGSLTAGVPSKSRPRSASCAIGSTTATTTTISSFVNDDTATNPLIDDNKTIDKVISHDIKQHHPSSHDLTSVTSNTTPVVQSMREYVINDLLNIDSRNQDGSATEDVDENMEEFLRIPPKLEGLMLFSLAVCMDSFLYIWSMLPLKFIWGVISLACSLYSPTKGVRGVKFHRR
jgi:hypothetical protein